jgi:poly(A) polymerase
VQPKIYTAADHHIREELINEHAVSVLRELQEAGYLAYLVGGGVRDLLLGKQPKDFDISTSARPEEVKELFGRRCLLIGRRFRLAHVRFGKEIIEVATFRAGDSQDEELITRDNIWGTPEEDALRRDFTINGLLYDPSDHKIIDYVGGFEDLQKHLLRSIGDPIKRFRQDPVRMLRALKFRARFDFKIDTNVDDAIFQCRQEILKSAPARLLEELLRMLESGASQPFFDLMLHHRLLELLLPTVAEALNGAAGNDVRTFLKAADEWMQTRPPEPPDRAALACCLLYPLLHKAIQIHFLDRNKVPSLSVIHGLCGDLVQDAFVEIYPRFTRRLCYTALFVLDAQYRMTPLTNRKMANDKLVKHPDFRPAVQFLRIRSLVNPELRKTYETFRDLGPPPTARPPKRQRPRRRRRR